MRKFALPVALATALTTSLVAHATTGDVRVPLTSDGGGTYEVDLQINGKHGPCTVDSGAAELSVSSAIGAMLKAGGGWSPAPEATFEMADGHKVTIPQIFVDTVRIGRATAHHVEIAIQPGGSCLVGENFLSQFHSVSLDYSHQQLVITP